MAGKLTATTLQVNDHATPTNNFVLKADNAGGVKLSRGNDGATSSDILSVNSAGKVTLLDFTTPLQDGLPTFACRAWVNFNGTGTVAIRASGNVASITDNGTGDYTINFTTPMPDANYSIQVFAGTTGSATSWVGALSNIGSPTASSFRIMTRSIGGTLADLDNIHIAVFR